MKDLNVNIHIGGAMRTGKTTLAKKLRTELAKMGYTSGLIDVDQTRTLTFGKDEPVLGNLDPKSRPEDVAPFQLQKKMQAWSYGNIFEVQIPLVVNAGAIPIFAATHAGPAYVDGKPVPIYNGRRDGETVHERRRQQFRHGRRSAREPDAPRKLAHGRGAHQAILRGLHEAAHLDPARHARVDGR